MGDVAPTQKMMTQKMNTSEKILVKIDAICKEYLNYCFLTNLTKFFFCKSNLTKLTYGSSED